MRKLEREGERKRRNATSFGGTLPDMRMGITLKIIENWWLYAGATEACQGEVHRVFIITGGSDALAIKTKPTELRLLC